MIETEVAVIDALYEDVAALRQRQVAALAKIEQLRAALLPFARLARYLVGNPDGNPLSNDVAVMHMHAAPGSTVITVGHVRAARDALRASEEDEKGRHKEDDQFDRKGGPNDIEGRTKP